MLPLPAQQGEAGSGQQQPPPPPPQDGGQQQPPLPLQQGGGQQQPPLPLQQVGGQQQPPPLPPQEGGQQLPPLPLQQGGGQQQPPPPPLQGGGQLQQPPLLHQGDGLQQQPPSPPPPPLQGVGQQQLNPPAQQGAPAHHQLNPQQPGGVPPQAQAQYVYYGPQPQQQPYYGQQQQQQQQQHQQQQQQIPYLHYGQQPSPQQQPYYNHPAQYPLNPPSQYQQPNVVYGQPPQGGGAYNYPPHYGGGAGGVAYNPFQAQVGQGVSPLAPVSAVGPSGIPSTNIAQLKQRSELIAQLSSTMSGSNSPEGCKYEGPLPTSSSELSFKNDPVLFSDKILDALKVVGMGTLDLEQDTMVYLGGAGARWARRPLRNQTTHLRFQFLYRLLPQGMSVSKTVTGGPVQVFDSNAGPKITISSDNFTATDCLRMLVAEATLGSALNNIRLRPGESWPSAIDRLVQDNNATLQRYPADMHALGSPGMVERGIQTLACFQKFTTLLGHNSIHFRRTADGAFNALRSQRSNRLPIDQDAYSLQMRHAGTACALDTSGASVDYDEDPVEVTGEDQSAAFPDPEPQRERGPGSDRRASRRDFTYEDRRGDRPSGSRRDTFMKDPRHREDPRQTPRLSDQRQPSGKEPAMSSAKSHETPRKREAPRAEPGAVELRNIRRARGSTEPAPGRASLNRGQPQLPSGAPRPTDDYDTIDRYIMRHKSIDADIQVATAYATNYDDVERMLPLKEPIRPEYAMEPPLPPQLEEPKPDTQDECIRMSEIDTGPLSHSARTTLLNIISAQVEKGLFPTSDKTELSQLHGREVSIPLIDENVTPIACKQQRFNPRDADLLNKEVDRMVTLDFRPLNKISKKNSGGIGNLASMHDRVRKSKWFTLLDLPQAYHQIAIKPSDRPKTAFRDARGRLHHYNRCAFGLSTIPAVFSALLGDTPCPVENKGGIERWLDDVLIHTETLEEHFKTLEEVLDLLQKAGRGAGATMGGAMGAADGVAAAAVARALQPPPPANDSAILSEIMRRLEALQEERPAEAAISMAETKTLLRSTARVSPVVRDMLNTMGAFDVMEMNAPGDDTAAVRMSLPERIEILIEAILAVTHRGVRGAVGEARLEVLASGLRNGSAMLRRHCNASRSVVQHAVPYNIMAGILNDDLNKWAGQLSEKALDITKEYRVPPSADAFPDVLVPLRSALKNYIAAGGLRHSQYLVKQGSGGGAGATRRHLGHGAIATCGRARRDALAPRASAGSSMPTTLPRRARTPASLAGVGDERVAAAAEVVAGAAARTETRVILAVPAAAAAAAAGAARRRRHLPQLGVRASSWDGGAELHELPAGIFHGGCSEAAAEASARYVRRSEG
eukprot:g19781.t1